MLVRSRKAKPSLSNSRHERQDCFPVIALLNRPRVPNPRPAARGHILKLG